MRTTIRPGLRSQRGEGWGCGTWSRTYASGKCHLTDQAQAPVKDTTLSEEKC